MIFIRVVYIIKSNTMNYLSLRLLINISHFIKIIIFTNDHITHLK